VLIILYTGINLPLAVWMLRSFFQEIPKDILDAARIDGAGIWREMVQIVLPMVTPGLVATVFLSIIFAWNEFFFAFNLASVGTSTVPMFMLRFVTSEGLFWAKLAASSTMAVLPIVLVGWVAQKQLVRGLSLGAVK
jgi:sorbitol/mannitol transport system permease protein